MLQKPTPILLAERFPALLDALLDLLDGLSSEEWLRPVHGGEWTVKDLAQHLLGDEVNIVSSRRDHFSGTYIALHSWDELVALINQRNAVWVEATRRMSPRLICELLRLTGDQANECFRTADPYALGGPVDWAGPQPAPAWLNLAREFSERWHHQQHIRDALGKPGCQEAYFLAPVLAAFIYALPHTFRSVEAPEGTAVTLRVSGPAGGTWSLVREASAWQLYTGSPAHTQAEIELPEDITWRLFTKGISKEEARPSARISGEAWLAEKVLDTVAILA